VIKEQEVEPVASVTSIAHKGFSKLKYTYRPSSTGLVFEMDEIKVRRRAAEIHFYDDKTGVFGYLSNEELLKPILSESDWGYQEWFALKRGWKPLFVDALASKKLELEFNFWKI